MQYALLIYENEAIFGPGKAGPKLQQVVGRHQEFVKELGTKRLGGAGLKSTSSATTVRTIRGQQTLHDGPFAETKEQLGGFYLIEAPHLDAAIAIAKKVPLLGDGAIEVRPVLGPG
ncbi:MAG: YciI family protein [Pseudomonadota bacterium]|nr:YciI family protein [Pseudomonadota bacterium]